MSARSRRTALAKNVAQLNATSAFTSSSAKGPQLHLAESDYLTPGSTSGVPSAFNIPQTSSFFDDGTAIEERTYAGTEYSGSGSARSGSTRRTVLSKKSARLQANQSAFSGNSAASSNRALPLSAANLDALTFGNGNSDAGTSLFVPVSFSYLLWSSKLC